ncbi:primosomal protein N' [Actinotalea sp. Marseille-Q4924]|uniref:primosomal protein N' family DNA-binding protein n=1 Tax=Actinotalea sp. Marseille-Q4924 TaxID=2866571 RepID=UPI001CE4178F|nr:primosomal protein N' [Actinotalea sp. Marseille-Q4924]
MSEAVAGQGGSSGDEGVQPTLTGLPTPRRRRVRGPVPLAERRPVARVVVDRPLTHLDRVFEYGVPASLDADVRAGVRVRVRFGGQDVDGFVVDRADEPEHDGELVPLRRVVSPEVVLTPAVLALARAVADRCAGTLADVLRLAVPPRHARTEAEDAGPGSAGGTADAPPGEVGPAVAGTTAGGGAGALGTTAPPTDTTPPWAPYAGGTAFLRHVVDGGAPRAVWSALPGRAGQAWADALAAAVVAALRGDRGALVVVPTATDVDVVTAALEAAGVPAWVPGAPVDGTGWVRLVAEDGPAARYRAFLAAVRGHAGVVVGTRAAAFAPVARLGLAVCWDEADPLHAEPRAPYPHARDVLLLRSQQEGAALLVGGFSRSTDVQRWVRDGVARPVQADRAAVRRAVARIAALGSADLAVEGPAAAARLPAPAWRAVRDGLTRGPVLVQVPRAGYVPAVACVRCRATARCPACHGPLGLPGASSAPSCRWCGRLAVGWRCPACRAEGLRAVRVGSTRTAEELGRAFTGVPVRQSGAQATDGVLTTVPDRPALVVATPGAEPRADAGYAAAVLLDAAVVSSRDALDVGESALRTWMRAAALVRPAPEGGVVVLVGDGAPRATQALVRWDPAGFAERELAERDELRLPPAVHVVAIEGPRHAVEDLLVRAALPGECDVLGPLPVAPPLEGESATVLLELPTEVVVRALVRTPWPLAPDVVARLAGARAARSARRDPGPVRLHVQPQDVL